MTQRPASDKSVLSEQNHFSEEILNAALRIKTEWGENFRKPIDERILREFPHLSRDEIAELDKIAGRAEQFIYKLAERELYGEISETDIIGKARIEIPWIDDANLFRLKNIGMFYARK
jgi:hypothetical protein